MVFEAANSPAPTEHQEELERALTDLVAVIEREVALFQHLLDSLNLQHQAVLEREPEPVLQSTAHVQEIVDEARRLDLDRTQKTVEVSSRLGLKVEQPSLSQIIPLVEGHYAERLRELRTMLLSLAQRVQETNLRNKRLVNRALQTVTKSMRLLTGQKGVYDGKGQEHPMNTELFTIQT